MPPRRGCVDRRAHVTQTFIPRTSVYRPDRAVINILCCSEPLGAALGQSNKWQAVGVDVQSTLHL